MGPDHIAAITNLLNPISLEDLNQRAALQTRADNKYFLPWPIFVDFAAALRAGYAVLDISGQRAFAYDTQYFDTAALTNYWAHVQGRRKRYKARTRRYVDSGLCVFEIKLKGRRGETIKHKMTYGAADCETVTPDAAAFLDACLKDAYGVGLDQPLLPTLRTDYQRATFTALDVSERVTCDFNLAFAADDARSGQMAPDHVLVEIKSARGRGEADKLLWRMGVRPSDGSKYCVGLSVVRPELRDNPFQTTSRRYFMADAAAEQPLASRALGAAGADIATSTAPPRPPWRGALAAALID